MGRVLRLGDKGASTCSFLTEEGPWSRLWHDLLGVRMKGTDQPRSWSNAEKKNKKGEQIILRLLHLEGKTGSVRGKEADPFSLPSGDGGGGSSEKNFGFGIHPIGVSRNSCKGYKVTVICSPKEKSKISVFSKK